MKELKLHRETLRSLAQPQQTTDPGGTDRSECYCAPSVGPGCETCRGCVRHHTRGQTGCAQRGHVISELLIGLAICAALAALGASLWVVCGETVTHAAYSPPK